jgi:hypothetical protein
VNIFHSAAVLSTQLICVIAVCCIYSVMFIVQSELNCDLCTVCCYPPRDCSLCTVAILERPVKVSKEFDMAAPFRRLHLTYV